MAVGVVGLSFGDFCLLTFDEFEAVLKAHRDRDDMMRHEEWERMRLHAVMTMQPHCKHRLHPNKVLPFEWEKTRSSRHVNSAPELSKPRRRRLS